MTTNRHLGVAIKIFCFLSYSNCSLALFNPVSAHKNGYNDADAGKVTIGLWRPSTSKHPRQLPMPPPPPRIRHLIGRMNLLHVNEVVFSMYRETRRRGRSVALGKRSIKSQDVKGYSVQAMRGAGGRMVEQRTTSVRKADRKMETFAMSWQDGVFYSSTRGDFPQSFTIQYEREAGRQAMEGISFSSLSSNLMYEYVQLRY
jgi:hypothetical protein